MANFFVFLLLVGIGSIFGPVGFIVGAIVGAIGWAGSASKNKAATSQLQPTKTETPSFTGREHASISLLSSSAAPTWAAPAPSGPRPEHLKEYTATVSQIFACFLSYFPDNDFPKVNTVTELMKSDDWVVDKFASLDVLANELQRMQKERQESAMLFMLRSNVLIERGLKLPSPMKTRLATHLDTLVGCMAAADSKVCRDFFDAFRQQLRKDHPASDDRLEAENLIMRSGDVAAISALQRMRKEPSRYRDMLRSGAMGNTVLKTALGVFAGVIAAEAVRAAITDSQKESLLQQVDQNIAKAGGVENLPLGDTELDALSSLESSDQSAFDPFENASYTSSNAFANDVEPLHESTGESYSEDWDKTQDPPETEEVAASLSSGDLQDYASDTRDNAAYESDSASDYTSDD